MNCGIQCRVAQRSCVSGLLAFALFGTGCNPNVKVQMNASAPTMADYRAAVSSGRNSIPVAVEIEEMFPECTDHFITHFGFANQPTIWNSESHFGGRYCLTMQLDIGVDYERNVVTAKSAPRFWLKEIVKVQQMSAGRFQAHYGQMREFAYEDWVRFKESDGDVSTIGLRANVEETARFDGYVGEVRRDRVPVSLIK